MKLFKKFIIPILLTFILLPNIVNAASGNISVTGPSTGVVGNNLTVTVTLSSSTAIGSWEFDIKYDTGLLELTSSTAESGGTHAASYAGSGGTKSKRYTFKFKVKKSGSATVRVSSSDVYAYADESRMSMSNGSKTITLKTQEEIEASYSKDAYLKSLTVGEYALNPAFNKETYNYEVEVENEVEHVNIDAIKNDSNASVSGAGEKDLVEGPNKFEIVVTAQKGNSLTYIVTVTRKELDPIKVTIDNKDLTIVRRKDTLPTELTGMTEKTVVYQGEEIPALYSDITDITIVGVKNEEGNIYTYIFNNGEIKNPYIELISNIKGIVPLNVEENNQFKNYKIKEIEIEGYKIKAFVLKDDSKFAVIYVLDATTNEKKYYTYNIETKTIMLYNNEIKDFYENQIQMYRYIILGGIGFIILLLLIIIFRKPKRGLTKEDLEKIESISNDKVEEVEEIQIEEEPIKEKKKRGKLKDLIYESEEEEVVEESKEEYHSGNTEQINNLLNKIESDKEDKGYSPKEEKKTKKKSVEDEVDEDTFIKTRKINLDEIADQKVTEIEEQPELSKRELRRLEKEEKKRARKERREQKKLLNRDEF